MAQTECNTRCTDTIHEWCGADMQSKNHLGDLFLCFNFALLLNYSMIDVDMVKKYTLIIIFISIIRNLMALTTQCIADIHPTIHTWSNMCRNNLWFIISGHTVLTTSLTLLIWNSNFPLGLKVCSMFFSVMVCIFQIATREHYSCDIIIALGFVFLLSSISKNYYL